MDDDGGVARRRFATADAEAAEDFLRATYVDQRLRIGGPARRFRYEHDARAAPGFSINRVRHSVLLSVDIAPLDDLLVADVVRGGRVVFERSGHADVGATVGGIVLVPPVGRSHTVMEDLDVDTLVLTQSGVAEYAAATEGVDPARFRMTSLLPGSQVGATHFRATVHHVRDSILGSPAASGSPIVLASAARLLTAAVLAAFPSTAASLAVPAGAVAPGRLRAVVDHLHDHAGAPVGPAEVAAVAGAPARVVDGELRRRHGTTAARELWRARLRGVHRDLLAADPDAVSVTDLAARWGFARPATFRVAYMRATRGETPERTLHRNG